jgi:hypothetical protein
LPMPTSNPRKRILNVAMPIRDHQRRLHRGIPLPMPDPRDEGESWSPPPVDTSVAAPAAPARLTLRWKPSSDLGINVRIEASSYFTTLVEHRRRQSSRSAR